MTPKEIRMISKRKFGNKFTFIFKKRNYSTKEIITIVCKFHGKFSAPCSKFLRRKYGCYQCAMIEIGRNKRMRGAQFVEKSSKKWNNKYGYDLIDDSELILLNNKLWFICFKHGKFKQKALFHLRGMCGCPGCKSDEQFLKYKQRANKIHNNKYDYSQSKYKNLFSRLKIICPNHGPFIVLATSHIGSAKSGCKQCRIEIRSQKLKNIFLEKAVKKHGDNYDYSLVRFINTTVKEKIICKKHGIINQCLYNHLQAKTPCMRCKHEKMRLTMTEFLEMARPIHGDKYDYSLTKFKTVSDKAIIICKKHGKFEQKIHSHIYQKSGCSRCSKIISKGEIEWLDYLGIPDDIRNKILIIGKEKRVFFPDAFDPKTNIIWEYYGDMWHGNIKIYDPKSMNKVCKMTFGQLYKRTMKREKYLQNHGFQLITIWETDWLALKKTLKAN
jgi:hypothetical protein